MTTIIRRRKLGMSSCKGIAEHSKTGIQWVRGDRKLPADELYIRWGCTVNVPCRNVINKATAIHLVNDKMAFRLLLEDHELCPATWTHFNDVPFNVLEGGVVVRPAKHAQGKRLWLCDDKEQLAFVCLNKAGIGYYISEYIPKVAEYRVFVVSGRVVCVAKKTPADPEAIAWNVAKGGRFDNVRFNNWPIKALRMSIEAFKLSGLDFGGVDVMVDEDGECYILEINSAPSLTSPYRQSCMAKAFDYIVENGKNVIPLIEEKGGYLKFIHPAICERAKMIGEV